jgi:hypothetical protein
MKQITEKTVVARINRILAKRKQWVSKCCTIYRRGSKMVRAAAYGQYHICETSLVHPSLRQWGMTDGVIQVGASRPLVDLANEFGVIKKNETIVMEEME